MNISFFASRPPVFALQPRGPVAARLGFAPPPLGPSEPPYSAALARAPSVARGQAAAAAQPPQQQQQQAPPPPSGAAAAAASPPPAAFGPGGAFASAAAAAAALHELEHQPTTTNPSTALTPSPLGAPLLSSRRSDAGVVLRAAVLQLPAAPDIAWLPEPAKDPRTARKGAVQAGPGRGPLGAAEGGDEGGRGGAVLAGWVAAGRHGFELDGVRAGTAAMSGSCRVCTCPIHTQTTLRPWVLLSLRLSLSRGSSVPFPPVTPTLSRLVVRE